jgi:hypothetical protein
VTEDVGVVRELVAQILDAPGPEGVPEPLAEVGRFQSAARRIIEANLEPEDEQRLLFELYKLAKDTAELVELAVKGIDWELAEAADVAPMPNRGWIAAQRTLRAAGYESCPLCEGSIATDDELRRYLQQVLATAGDELSRYRQKPRPYRQKRRGVSR